MRHGRSERWNEKQNLTRLCHKIPTLMGYWNEAIRVLCWNIPSQHKMSAIVLQQYTQHYSDVIWVLTHLMSGPISCLTSYIFWRPIQRKHKSLQCWPCVGPSYLTACFSPQKAHYNAVIMGAIASQITSLTIVYPTVYSDADQRKHQSSASLAFVRGIHRRPVNSPHKWPVTRKMFPFDDVIM